MYLKKDKIKVKYIIIKNTVNERIFFYFKFFNRAEV